MMDAYAQRGGQRAWTLGGGSGRCSSSLDDPLACGGMDATDQHGMWNVLLVGDHVEQVMDAIAEVHICSSSPRIHGFIAFRSSSTERMRCTVGDPGIGFRLGDEPTGDLPIDPCDQQFPEQFTGDAHHIIAQIEFTW